MARRTTGGFFGSVGSGANYFPDQEISWAVKYTLDALQTVTRAHFDKTYKIYPTELRQNDGRLKLISDSIEKVFASATLLPVTVLDVGAGKGRFASALKKIYPSADIYATDLSEKMLSFGKKTTF